MDDLDHRMQASLLRKLKNGLMGLWLFSPILSPHMYNGFLRQGNQSEIDSLALVSLLIGEINISFFVIPLRGDIRFKIIQIRILSEIDQFNLSDKKAEQLYDSYEKHFQSLKVEEQSIEKEALIKHLDDEQSRI